MNKRKRSSSKQRDRLKGILPSVPAPPPVIPPPIVNPPSQGSSETRDRFILMFIEILVLGGLFSLLGQQNYALKKFSDIRFEVQNVPDDPSIPPDELQRKYLIYKLGDQPVWNVTALFGIAEEQRLQYEIKNAFIKEYERGIFNIFSEESTNYNAKGRVVPPVETDPDYRTANSYRFRFDQLSPDYVYALTVTLKKKSSATDDRFKFELTDENNQIYDHKMERVDYVRIHITELSLLGILFLAALAFGMWKLNKRLFAQEDRNEIGNPVT